LKELEDTYTELQQRHHIRYSDLPLR